ncbi:MAG: hypothetical protein AAB619_01320 [Patescibacteria group bacterium]
MAADSRYYRRWVMPLLLYGAVVVWVAAGRWPRGQVEPVATDTVRPCPTTVAERINQADVILSGRVAMVIPGGPGGAEVIINPIEVYQGAISMPTVTIHALDDRVIRSGPMMRPSDFHFASDQPPYLLYLRRQSDGTYLTRRCEGSRWLGPGLNEAEQRLLTRPTAT